MVRTPHVRHRPRQFNDDDRPFYPSSFIDDDGELKLWRPCVTCGVPIIHRRAHANAWLTRGSEMTTR